MVQTHTRSSAQPKTEAAVGAVAAAAASAVAAAAAAATTKSVRSFYSRRAGELRARTRSRAHIVNADPQRCYLSRKAVEHGYHKISSYGACGVADEGLFATALRGWTIVALGRQLCGCGCEFIMGGRRRW